MHVISIVILASAAIPLAVAWRANSNTTLRHALGWAGLAWMAWLAFGCWPGMLTGYAALTLTCCAGIAVFGARRPGLAAWDFIVASLLVVLWLGWAEGLVAGTELKLGGFRMAFLSLLLLATIFNYLPTRIGFGAATLVGALFATMAQLKHGEIIVTSFISILVGMAPWIAWLELKMSPSSGCETDLKWQRFRDRFGVVWGLRLQEQFNRAAINASWPVELRWNGLRSKSSEIRPEWLDTLVALQKRFYTTDSI